MSSSQLPDKLLSMDDRTGYGMFGKKTNAIKNNEGQEKVLRFDRPRPEGTRFYDLSPSSIDIYRIHIFRRDLLIHRAS